MFLMDKHQLVAHELFSPYSSSLSKSRHYRKNFLRLVSISRRCKHQPSKHLEGCQKSNK